MPRDAHETRELLVQAGRELFARDGVHQVPLRSIVLRAGQRNESALHYHFGNRQGLLDAIIATHDDRIEAERKDHLAGLDQAGLGHRLEQLVAALVVPYARPLLDPAGREFLQIIAQLSSLFDGWDGPDAPEQARTVFSRIADTLDGLPPSVRHLRITTFLDLVTQALAARARSLDSGGTPELDHDTFVANLIAMSIGALSTPLSAGIEALQTPNASSGSIASNSRVCFTLE